MRCLSKALILCVFITFIVASCSKQYINTNSQTLLEERIKEFYSDLNPKNAWELLSQDLKKKNRNNEEEYIKHFEKNLVFKNLHFYIISIDINENKAKVKIRLTAEFIGTGGKLDDVLYDYWVFEDNNWYMNDPNNTQ